MYEGLGTNPDPNVKILCNNLDLHARILKNNPDSNGRFLNTLIFPAKWILHLKWSLIFFLQDWRVVLGEFDDSKEDGWEQTFEVESSSSDHFKLMPLATI